MKTLKNIARFAFMTFTTGITIFFFFILLCRTDLVVDLFSSKPVLLMLGLTIGAIVGLLVGVITTYLRFAKILEERNSEVNRLKKDLRRAQNQVTRLLPEVEQARKFNSDKSAEEAKSNCDKRAKQIFSAIGDLSENDAKPGAEEEVDANDDEVETQDDMSSDEA